MMGKTKKMDDWSSGMMGKKHKILAPIIPSFQYSNFPAFHYSNIPITQYSGFWRAAQRALRQRRTEGMLFVTPYSERWNGGTMEQMAKRKDGIMEYWNDGEKNKMPKPNIPTFQYSNIPMVFGFHYSTIPLFQFLEE